MARQRARPARRVYFFKWASAARAGEDGLSYAWRARRLAEPGTALPAAFPWRAELAAAGVLALEDIDGASARALAQLGLRSSHATDVFHRIEGITVPTLYFSIGPRAGEAYDQDEVTLFSSSARTASFTGDAYEVGDRGELRLTHAVTAVSGTLPQMQVQIDTRRDSSDSWRVVDAFPVATAVGTYRKVFSGLDRQVRHVTTIAGTTPSFTSSLVGEAV